MEISYSHINNASVKITHSKNELIENNRTHKTYVTVTTEKFLPEVGSLFSKHVVLIRKYGVLSHDGLEKGFKSTATWRQ